MVDAYEVDESSPSKRDSFFSMNFATSASRGLSTSTGTPKPSITSEAELNAGE